MQLVNTVVQNENQDFLHQRLYWDFSAFSLYPWTPIKYCKNPKQVAQRATIAHLSPICQGQMSWFSNLLETDEIEKALVNYVQLHQTWPIKQILKKQIFWSSTSRTWHPLISKNINGPWKPEARNGTRLSFHACSGYQQLWWWFDQKWMS